MKDALSAVSRLGLTVEENPRDLGGGVSVVALEDGSKAESSSDRRGRGGVSMAMRGNLQGNSWQLVLNEDMKGKSRKIHLGVPPFQEILYLKSTRHI